MTTDDNGPWVCLTPRTDANGRRLSLEERLEHAGRELGRVATESFHRLDQQLEASPDVTLEERCVILRAVLAIIEASLRQDLEQIAAHLQMDHAALGKYSDTLH